MSDIVEEAIKETITRARQLLSNRRGKLKGPEARLGLFTLQIVIPKAKAADVLNPQDGQTFFDFQGDTRVYNAGVGDLLIGIAAKDPLIDRALCCAGAMMLENLRGIPDRQLRSYIGGRLLSGLAPVAKRKRGQKKTDNSYRDITIAGRLIPPLLDRFNATRSGGTREKGTAESACSIVSKALARMGHSGYDGINISEIRSKTFGGRMAPFWCDHDLTSSRSIPN